MIRGFAFDTSALVSLGHTDLVPVILENFEITVTRTIVKELGELARYGDADARAAGLWLENTERLQVLEAPEEKSGEDELFDICRATGLRLVSDDLRAVRRFRTEIRCYFATKMTAISRIFLAVIFGHTWCAGGLCTYRVHIVYILYKRGIISLSRSVIALQRMRTGRDWKQNAISAAATLLFK